MKLRDAHWSLCFLCWLLGVTALGATAGCLLFPLGGALLQEKPAYGSLALEGARRVGFIFFIWAPAIALVACVMRAYRRQHHPAGSKASQADHQLPGR